MVLQNSISNENVNGINAHIGHIKITYGRSNHTYFTKDKKQDLDLWKNYIERILG